MYQLKLKTTVDCVLIITVEQLIKSILNVSVET